MTPMMSLLALLRALLQDRARMAIENTALRHQVAVLKRSVKRPRIRDSDRIFWILLPPFGTLGLDPGSLLRLAAGTIPSGGPVSFFPPSNTATHTFVIPDEPWVEGLDVHFQALVLDPTNGTGSFTNAPVIHVTP